MILFSYKNNIKDTVKLERAINTLSIKTEKNLTQYYKNDTELLSIYLEQLSSVQNKIDLDNLYTKLNNAVEIVKLKRLDQSMSILKSYIKIYDNYRLFIEYSKSYMVMYIEDDIANYYNRVLSLFKKYERLKTGYIFESFRKKLQTIFQFYRHYFLSKSYREISNSNLKEAINSIIYVIDDIRLYYPDCEYSIILIEKKIYNIIREFAQHKIETLYAPSRSNIQFQIVSNCDKNLLKYIIERNYKPKKSSHEDFSLTVFNFIISIDVNKMNDIDVYNYLENNFKKNKIQPLIYNDIKFVVESNEFSLLVGQKHHLDIGSKNFSLDMFGSDIVYTSINLAETTDGDDGEDKVQINKNERLPFSDNYFSIITSFMVLHNLSDIESSLSEIFRILKKGGIFIVREYNCDSECKKIFADIDEIITDTKLVSTPYNTSTKEWKDILKNAGFVFRGENNGRLTSVMMFTK